MSSNEASIDFKIEEGRYTNKFVFNEINKKLDTMILRILSLEHSLKLLKPEWYICMFIIKTRKIWKQRSSKVLRGPQRSSKVLKVPQRSSKVLKGPQRSSKVLRGPQRSSKVLKGPQRSSKVSPVPIKQPVPSKLKFGIDTKSSMENSKILVPATKNDDVTRYQPPNNRC